MKSWFWVVFAIILIHYNTGVGRSWFFWRRWLSLCKGKTNRSFDTSEKSTPEELEVVKVFLSNH